MEAMGIAVPRGQRTAGQVASRLSGRAPDSSNEGSFSQSGFASQSGSFRNLRDAKLSEGSFRNSRARASGRLLSGVSDVSAAG